MTLYDDALKLHEDLKGKLDIKSKSSITTKEELSLLYSPGVAEPCRAIHKNEDLAYKYTIKSNTILVVSDGSAVLGLGNIGAKAAMPVMEGKCCLFKEFGDVNAVPIVLDTQDTEEIIKTVKYISAGYGGVNLEDISAPRCIEIEKRLKEELDIPVFHDDQHGTAIVVTAALINSLKLVNKDPKDITLTISGTGAAGSSIIKMLKSFGIGNIYAFNTQGILTKDEDYTSNYLYELSLITNNFNENLDMKQALSKSDVFIGVSAGNILTKDMVKSMKEKSIVFALANPDPEISYDDAIEAGAYIVGTGRSDYPNQINNVLAFPGLFKGALESRAKSITEEMKLAASFALANLVGDELSKDKVIPSPFDKRVGKAVSEAIINQFK